MKSIKNYLKYLLSVVGVSPTTIMYRLLRFRGVLKYDSSTDTIIRNVLGHKMHLNIHDTGLSKQLALKGTREEESVVFIKQLITPDMIILDLGANIGFYVLIEAGILKKGNGRIIALEPLRDNIKLLRLNVKASKYEDRVKIIEGAVSDHSGNVELAVFDAFNSNFLVELAGDGFSGRTETVRAYTFQELLLKAGLKDEKLDMLRMDIEGAEYLFMDSMLEYIRPLESFLIFVELHPGPSNIERHKKLLRELEILGFKCIGATKEYSENGSIKRVPFIGATIHDLYTNDILLKPGGCEVFLKK